MNDTWKPSSHWSTYLAQAKSGLIDATAALRDMANIEEGEIFKGQLRAMSEDVDVVAGRLQQLLNGELMFTESLYSEALVSSEVPMNPLLVWSYETATFTPYETATFTPCVRCGNAVTPCLCSVGEP